MNCVEEVDSEAADSACHGHDLHIVAATRITNGCRTRFVLRLGALPGHLDHVPIRVEAFEPDVGRVVLVFDQHHAIGEQPGSQTADLVRRSHLEAEMGETRNLLGRLLLTESQGEAVGVTDDDDAVGVPTSRRGVEAEVAAVEVD